MDGVVKGHWNEIVRSSEYVLIEAFTFNGLLYSTASVALPAISFPSDQSSYPRPKTSWHHFTGIRRGKKNSRLRRSRIFTREELVVSTFTVSAGNTFRNTFLYIQEFLVSMLLPHRYVYFYAELYF